jgi:hypothetical protein
VSKTHADITQTVGNTPLVRLNRGTAGLGAQVASCRCRGGLARFGKVLYNDFLLSFQIGDRELVLFPTGRAVSHGELARYALGIEDPDDVIADLDQALRRVPVG